MFASTFAFGLALAGAANAVSTAALVAELREAPTQVDRIRALNDTQVNQLHFTLYYCKS